MKTQILLLIAIILLPQFSNAQEKELFTLNKSSLIVYGTSSLHDWDMKAQDVSCSTATEFQNNSLKSIESINFKCKSNSLLSEHSLMDSKAHDALKAKKFPEIIFKLDASEIVNSSTTDFNGFLMGTLTLAGVAKKIKVPVNGLLSSTNTFNAKGELSFRMSDFKIDPPTAMFGTITTGDEIKIVYDFVFTKEESQAITENK